METYSYVNIFETKGLEYLLLIAFLLLFIFFVRYLNERPARSPAKPPEENGRRAERPGRNGTPEREPAKPAPSAV